MTSSTQNRTASSDSRSTSRSTLNKIMPQGRVGKGAAAAAGVAAAAGAAYAAFRKFGGKNKASNGQAAFHVRPGENGWKLEREGSSEPEEVFPTKADAVDAGRHLARKQEPSELFVYRSDGTVERQHCYGDTN